MAEWIMNCHHTNIDNNLAVLRKSRPGNHIYSGQPAARHGSTVEQLELAGQVGIYDADRGSASDDDAPPTAA